MAAISTKNAITATVPLDADLAESVGNEVEQTMVPTFRTPSIETMQTLVRERQHLQLPTPTTPIAVLEISSQAIRQASVGNT